MLKLYYEIWVDCIIRLKKFDASIVPYPETTITGSIGMANAGDGFGLGGVSHSTPSFGSKKYF